MNACDRLVLHSCVSVSFFVWQNELLNIRQLIKLVEVFTRAIQGTLRKSQDRIEVCAENSAIVQVGGTMVCV